MNNQDILNKPIHNLNNTKVIQRKPKYINLRDIKQQRIKKDIKDNPNITKKDLMLKNGYALTTASHKNGACGLVERAIAEVREELKHSGITPDFIIHRLEEDRKFAIKKKDASTAVRVTELQGKSIGLFIDKSEVSQVEKAENQFFLDRLARLRVSGN